MGCLQVLPLRVDLEVMAVIVDSTLFRYPDHRMEFRVIPRVLNHFFSFLWQINLRGLFNGKAILEEDQKWEIMGFMLFSIEWEPKINVIARLDFELSNYIVAVQYISHWTMWTPYIHIRLFRARTEKKNRDQSFKFSLPIGKICYSFSENYSKISKKIFPLVSCIHIYSATRIKLTSQSLSFSKSSLVWL